MCKCKLTVTQFVQVCPPPPRPLFSLFVQVRWCLLVLSFSFVSVLFLFFLLVQPFYKRPCVAWKCIVERACVVMVFFLVVLVLASSRLGVSVCVCQPLESRLKTEPQTVTFQEYVYLFVLYRSLLFSPLTFSSPSFLLRQVYVILHPRPLSFCA